MNRPVRRYVEKYESLEFSAGAYHARKLQRARYHANDFLEYLSSFDAMDPELPGWPPEED